MRVDMSYENKVERGKQSKGRDANQTSKPNSLGGDKAVPEKEAHKHSSRKMHISTDVN